MSFLSKFGYIDGTSDTNTALTVFTGDVDGQGNDLTNLGLIEANSGVFDNLTVQTQLDSQGTIVNTTGDVTIQDNALVTGNLTVNGVLNYSSLNPPIVPGMSNFTITSTNPVKINTSTNTENVTNGESVNVSLDPSGVTPGSYTYSNVTVDSFGRVTSASNGVAPVVPLTKTVTSTAPITVGGNNSFYGPNNLSMTLTHANSGVVAGTYGTGATAQVPSVTVNGTGHVTSASTATIPSVTVAGVAGDITGTGTVLSTGSNINLGLANTAVTPGTYGSTSLIPSITVDAKGRLTNVTTNAVSASGALESVATRNWGAGTGRVVGTSDNVVIGDTASCGTNSGSVAIGSASLAPGNLVTSVGWQAGLSSTGTGNSLILGAQANVIGTNSTACGTQAICTGANSFAGGTGVFAGANTVCINGFADVQRSVCIGALSLTQANDTTLLGYNNRAGPSSSGSVLLGRELGQNTLTGLNNVMVGNFIGQSSITSGSSNVLIGSTINAAGPAVSNSIAIGGGITNIASNSITLGLLASAQDNDGISIGRSSLAGGQSAICIGQNSSTSNIDCLAIGRASSASGLNSISIGQSSSSSTADSVSIGRATFSSGQRSLTVGSTSQSTNTDSQAFGYGLVNNIANTTLIGSTGTNALAHVVRSTGLLQAARSYFCFARDTVLANYGGGVTRIPVNTAVNDPYSLIDTVNNEIRLGGVGTEQGNSFSVFLNVTYTPTGASSTTFVFNIIHRNGSGATVFVGQHSVTHAATTQQHVSVSALIPIEVGGGGVGQNVVYFDVNRTNGLSGGTPNSVRMQVVRNN